MKYHYYCLNCGTKFYIPSIYKSCDTCNQEYKQGKKYDKCKRCGTKKFVSEYGLCLKCYNQILKCEEKKQIK